MNNNNPQEENIPAYCYNSWAVRIPKERYPDKSKPIIVEETPYDYCGDYCGYSYWLPQAK